MSDPQNNDQQQDPQGDTHGDRCYGAHRDPDGEYRDCDGRLI
ncbi:hypothetical protein GCM10010495_62860 [Kitasatospora herbaricolor]|nr:hypothetical protein [Kitasatospora herbaricolor]MDQ0311322.1 hypothetical protein [Kitasatospora herbaricolor]GGV37085.1 hypothetical protein GCM10010495_62860 [Kitasatospora herbaricolor]